MGEARLLEPGQSAQDWHFKAMLHLVQVVQELSHARDLEGVMQVVRMAARELTGADGATFVLKDGDKCFYAEENAVSPLWKGQRFPLKSCISGWAMLNKQPAVIEDIFSDPRIPVEAYRPTFVKSLAMVPIRRDNPLGAIGNYWAHRRQPLPEEVAILQALADVTSVAIENAGLYNELQQKIRALEDSNEELQKFAWISSHDLKSPLRAINNLAEWAIEDAAGPLLDKTREQLNLIRHRARRMEKLLDDILEYANIENKLDPGKFPAVDGAQLMGEVVALVHVPQGFVLHISPSFAGVRLPRMPLQRIFANLINNGFKHHDKKEGRVEVLAEETESGYIFTVKDDGPGIAPQYREKIFEMFQTLRPRDQVEGSGMGLAVVRKLLAAQNLSITVDNANGERGALFRFNWPKPLDIRKIDA